MIGGETEDDIAELLTVINGQQAGLGVVHEGDQGETQDQDIEVTNVVPSVPALAQSSGHMETAMMLLIQAQTDQNRQNAEMMKKLMETKDDVPRSEGKRRRDEISYYPQEPVLIDQDYRITDNGHKVIDCWLRQWVRPINACPTTYWIRGSFKQVERPINGA